MEDKLVRRIYTNVNCKVNQVRRRKEEKIKDKEEKKKKKEKKDWKKANENKK